MEQRERPKTQAKNYSYNDERLFPAKLDDPHPKQRNKANPEAPKRPAPVSSKSGKGKKG